MCIQVNCYLKKGIFLKVSGQATVNCSRHSEKVSVVVEKPSKLNDHQRNFANYLDRVTLTNQNQNTRTKILKNGEETFQEIKRVLNGGKGFYSFGVLYLSL